MINQALQLARMGRNLPPPNPSVGCVITSANGQILGQGHTQQAGGPHAEVMAIQNARDLGHNLAGATAYVTLEPCAHQGRTGPCCDALIAAGIAKVVASLADPNPLVAGQGFARLRAAGVEVQVGLGANESRELNIGFFSRMVRQKPWVRMKMAASLDGQTALQNGVSQWITSEPARADGHAWRARACAVLTGIGTVLADNPKLDVRLVPTQRQPWVVVIDSQLETPVDANLFMPGRHCLIYAAIANPGKQAALEASGASVVYLPGKTAETAHKVDLSAMLMDLGQREVNELHIEAGHKLNGSFMRENLVDEFLIYLAPKLIGLGQGMSNFGPLTQLNGAIGLEFHSMDRVGVDLRVVARPPNRADF